MGGFVRRCLPHTVYVFILLSASLPCGLGTERTPSDPPLAKAAPVIDRISIAVKQGFAKRAYFETMVRRLIDIEKGERFSALRVETAIQALRLCGKFSHVEVDATEDEGFMQLFFQVTPFQYIRHIRIDGKYPLFEQDVLNAMTIYPGDPYRPRELQEQAKMVAALYRRHGYIDPQVSISDRQHPKDGTFEMHVVIDKGPAYDLGRLVFGGNRFIPQETLAWQMGTWRKFYFGGATARFVDRQFREDIDHLIQFYRSRRYADVAIRHHVERLPRERMLRIRIDIEEGPLYQVLFEGNTHFSSSSLLKGLPLFKAGNRSDIGLRKSLRQIKKRYKEAGFSNVAVDTVDTPIRENGRRMRRIRFVVREGPRTIVQAVTVHGHTAFKAPRIKKRMLTRAPGVLHDGAFDPDVLAEDLLSIKALYEENGYLDVRVSSREIFGGNGETVNIAIDIEEGPQTLVSGVHFHGLAAVSAAKLKKGLKLKAGRPLSLTGLEKEKIRIASHVSEKGHPYVTVAVDTHFSGDRSRAALHYRIEEGIPVTMGHTYYSGNFRTRKRRLDQELKMKSGEPFSLRKMFRGQQQIRAMNIFRSVDFRTIGLKEKSDQIHLFANVEEEKPYFFELGGGYESDKGLYGVSKVGDHNFLGLNKDVWLSGELSQIGHRAASGFFEPSLFATRVSADLTLYTEEEREFNQTFGTRVYGANLNFSRRWRKRLTGRLGMQYETREIIEASQAFEDDNETAPRAIVTVIPSLQYDSRDYFMRPRKGMFAALGIDISNGIKTIRDDFLRYRFDLRFYHTPIDRITLAWMGRAGYIDPYGGNRSIPDDQLFYLGGTADIRGFDENLFMFDENGDPLGGRSTVLSSVEARIDLGRQFELALFYDIGRLSQVEDVERASDIRSSTGVGLRYVTPVGAIGFVYGFKLDPKQDEPPGRLHFSVGYTF